VKHILTIKPAISPKMRHRIQDILEEAGCEIIGGGTHTDGSSCDISFERDDPRDRDEACNK